MATVIDITNKIKNEEKFIKLGEKSYKVDASKNNMIEVQALFQSENKTDIELMEDAVELLIGKKAKTEIDKMNLDMNDYRVVFVAIFACASDISYEDAEERFQNSEG